LDEELVAEYLELEGYFVRTNIPLPAKERGGRGEIDVLGIKVEGKQLKVIHVETGIPNLLRDIEKKFKPSTMREIQRIVREFGFKKPHLEHWFINASWTKGTSKKWKEIKEKLERRGITCMALRDFLPRIQEAIDQWREKHRGKVAKQTLPGDLWLLKMQEAQAMCGPGVSSKRKNL
jgi:hypothetical protein